MSFVCKECLENVSLRFGVCEFSEERLSSAPKHTTSPFVEVLTVKVKISSIERSFSNTPSSKPFKPTRP